MYRNLLLFCLLALSLNCTTRGTTSDNVPQTVNTVTRASAAKMIANSTQFKDKSRLCDKLVPIYFFNKAGWSSPRSYGDNSPIVKVPPNSELIKQTDGWLTWLYTEGYLVVRGYELVPSEKGNGVMKLTEGGDWMAPLAIVQLSEVTGIKEMEVPFGGGKGAKVAEFTFHYLLAPLGKELFKVGSLPEPRRGLVPVKSMLRCDPEKTYNGSAYFELYDDGWRLKMVEGGE